MISKRSRRRKGSFSVEKIWFNFWKEEQNCDFLVLTLVKFSFLEWSYFYDCLYLHIHKAKPNHSNFPEVVDHYLIYFRKSEKGITGSYAFFIFQHSIDIGNTFSWNTKMSAGKVDQNWSKIDQLKKNWLLLINFLSKSIFKF